MSSTRSRKRAGLASPDPNVPNGRIERVLIVEHLLRLGAGVIENRLVEVEDNRGGQLLELAGLLDGRRPTRGP